MLCIGTSTNARETSQLQFNSHISGHASFLWSTFATDVLNDTQNKVNIVDVYADRRMLEAADIVELNMHDAISACDSGALNLLPLHELKPSNGIISHQYTANSIQPCSIGHSIWADVVSFDKRQFSSDLTPEKISDFFNFEKFPGKRAIKKSARGLFEWILINDNYSYNEIYLALSRASSWDTISNLLTSMHKEIIWVDTDNQALELVDEGLAVFAAVSSHSLVRRVFENTGLKNRSSNHYGVVWQGAVVHMNFLALPKNRNAERALELLKFAIEPERNLLHATSVGYTPVRADQVALIKERYRQVSPIDYHLDDVLWGNSKWWRETGRPLELRFYKFLDAQSIDGEKRNSSELIATH